MLILNKSLSPYVSHSLCDVTFIVAESITINCWLKRLLFELFRASVTLSYVYHEPGETAESSFLSYSAAKAYRHISLFSFLPKTMERLVDVCDRGKVPGQPLHMNQHAYQAGKSSLSALNDLESKVEDKVALCTSLDIEGSLDNTSHRTIVQKQAKPLIPPFLCGWRLYFGVDGFRFCMIPLRYLPAEGVHGEGCHSL